MNSALRILMFVLISALLNGCGGGGSSSPPAPLPPTANSATSALDEDTSVQGTLTGSASSGGALTFAIASQPSNGVLTANGASYTYTPNADFFGNDSFNFTVTESGRTSAPATINITVL